MYEEQAEHLEISQETISSVTFVCIPPSRLLCWVPSLTSLQGGLGSGWFTQLNLILPGFFGHGFFIMAIESKLIHAWMETGIVLGTQFSACLPMINSGNQLCQSSGQLHPLGMLGRQCLVLELMVTVIWIGWSMVEHVLLNCGHRECEGTTIFPRCPCTPSLQSQPSYCSRHGEMVGWQSTATCIEK